MQTKITAQRYVSFKVPLSNDNLAEIIFKEYPITLEDMIAIKKFFKVFGKALVAK